VNPKVKTNKKILVALSGGVDSSVAAALLIRQLAEGQVEGAYMRCWSEGPYCNADTDEADAAKVAGVLEIPFHVFNFEKEYKERVIDGFLAEYEAGRTPNPDVMCNREIKFGLFLKKALELGFDYIATGHYSRIQNSKLKIKNGSGNGKSKKPQFKLLTGGDTTKDQSYFLYQIGQRQLSRTIFPLGDLKKSEVRKLAKKFGLPTAERRESMGICFVGPAQIKEFLMQKIKIRHGDIVSVDGRLLGKHIGLPFYTIGQREGLGISEPVPYYVVDKNIDENTLVVAPFGHEALYKRRFTIEAPHWVEKEPALPVRVDVRLRHRAPTVKGTIKKDVEDRLEVSLEEQARAVTPGQSAVFYKGNKVLGGAVVRKIAD
jgi:tRNA-specific 2-thiouridylase